MSIYTRRLGSGRFAAGAWQELYRAPSVGTTVLRHVTIAATAVGGAGESAIRVRPLTKAGEFWLWYTTNLQAGSTAFDLRQALEPNEALEVLCTTGTIDVAVTGYVFAA